MCLDKYVKREWAVKDWEFLKRKKRKEMRKQYTERKKWRNRKKEWSWKKKKEEEKGQKKESNVKIVVYFPLKRVVLLTVDPC